MPNPWDQLPDEPDEAYARFNLYRALGPGRSLMLAYRTYLDGFRNSAPRQKRPQVPGHWSDDSSKYKWVDRAHQWDSHMLSEYGERIGVRFVGAMDKLAEKVVAAMAQPRVRPKDWKEAVEALETLARYVTPDAINRLRERVGGGRDARVAEQPAKPAREQVE